MNNIRIIKNKTELEGTVYFEFLPGAFSGICWNEGSLFLDDETFGFLEIALEKHIPDYDRYEFIEIKLEAWLEVIREWQALQLLIKNHRSKLRSISSP